MRICLVILSIVGLVAWSGFMILAIALSGLGDGASNGGSRVGHVLMLIPFAYLMFSLLSCFSFIKGKALVISGIVAHSILFVFIVFTILAFKAVAIIFVAFGVLFSLFWYGMFLERRSGEKSLNSL